MLKEIYEAKDLNLYKLLLGTFGSYSDKFPATQVSRLFKDVMTLGMKVIPKNKVAQEILLDIIKMSSVPDAVGKLLNMRFADLDVKTRPIYKDGNTRAVAFWKKDGKVNDKVFALLNFEGKDGSWSNALGDSVKLVDIE